MMAHYNIIIEHFSDNKQGAYKRILMSMLTQYQSNFHDHSQYRRHEQAFRTIVLENIM